MEKRRLGRTGHRSTVVTFGAYSIGYVDQDEADRAIQLVLDHDVNHVDIAPSYAESMERIAPWMPEIRDRCSSAPRRGSGRATRRGETPRASCGA